MLNCASVSSRISPYLPPMFFTLFASHRCRLSVTPQPYVLVKETLNEFDQSSGRTVSGLPSQNRNDLHEKQVTIDSNESPGIFLFCLSTDRRCLHECEVKCDHRELFSLLAQVTTEMWVIFPTSHEVSFPLQLMVPQLVRTRR